MKAALSLPKLARGTLAALLLSCGGMLKAQTALTLFNGSNLTGWNAHGSWSVSSGAIISSGSGNGSILTAVPFADCNLQFDYQESAPVKATLHLWSSKDAAGGLAIDLDTSGAKNGTGGIATLSRSSLRALSPGWHRVEVNASHGQVAVRIDGNASANASGLGSRAGYIGFSVDSGGSLQVRNVRVTPLNLISAFNGADLGGWKSIAKSPDSKGGAVHSTEKVLTFGIAGGSTKPHEAKWLVRSGAIHGESGPGGLENGTGIEDAVIQLSVNYKGDVKGDNFTTLSLRNNPGQIGTGYAVGLGPYAGSVGHAGKSLGKANSSVEQTIVIAGRTIAVWNNGMLAGVNTDSRPDGGNAGQGARTQAGSVMLTLPNDREQIDISRLSISPLPKTYGIAARAGAPQPPSSVPVASVAPSTAAPASAGDSAAAQLLQKQQEDQARKDAETEADKQRVSGLMQQALASGNDPVKQQELYGQVMQIDPANPNAMQGYKDAQAKAQQMQNANAQAANNDNSEKMRQEQTNASLVNAQSAFLAGHISEASQALSVAERMSPGNPLVQELRRRIGAAQSLRSRLYFLGGGVGLLALAAAVAAWLRRRRTQRFPVIEVTSGIDAGQIFRVEKDPTRIGAVPQDAGQKNDIVVHDVEHAISRFHCEIVRRDGQLYLHDLNSSNGTRVDGERLQPGNSALLRKGTRIQLAGTVELRFGYARGAKKA